MISPESVVSEVCSRELQTAAQQRKRIVPILHRAPGGTEVPEAAASLNWVFLRDQDDFDAGVELLVAAVETDLEHVRTHTRVGVQAGRWESADRDRSLLLRGSELAAVEAWIVAAAGKDPGATTLQREYVLASRQAATRRQRTVIGGVSIALLVAVVLAVVAVIQRSTAIHETNVAYARFLDAAAQNQIPTDPELSVLLAAHAARFAPGAPTEQALRAALWASHVRQRFSLGQADAGDVLWSPDGTRVLVTSPGTWARVYRPGSTAKPLELGTPPSSRGDSGWDAKGDRVLIGGAQPAVYDPATGALIRRLPGPAIAAAISPDGSRVATTDLQSAGHVYEIATGREISVFHPVYRGGVTCIAWSPQGSVIAQCNARSLAGSDTRSAIDTWDPGTGKLLHSLPCNDLVASIAFSPDGRRYAFATTTGNPKDLAAPGTLVIDAHTGALIKSFPGSATAVAFSADGTRLAYATLDDNLGHVYDFGSGVSHPLVGNGARIEAIHFSANGADVVTASLDRTAQIFDAFNGGSALEVLAGHTERLRDATFGLGDTMIATTSEDGTARLWAVSVNPRPAVNLPGPGGLVASVAFTPDSRQIVVAGPKGAGRILQVSDLRTVAAFSAPPASVLAGAGAGYSGDRVAAMSGPAGKAGPCWPRRTNLGPGARWR